MKFCGREAELETLVSRWKLASNLSNPRPQLVIVKAERGVGKTRLALEFYRWLSENVDAKGEEGYWPDTASVLDRSMDVNPDPFACGYGKPFPYLWWGLRGSDPGAENPVSGDAVASYDRFLAPHLGALTLKARSIKSGAAILSIWKDVAKGEVAGWTGYDTAISVGEALFNTVKIVKGTLDQSSAAALSEVNKKPIKRVDAVLEDLEQVLNPRSLGFAKTPAVILIDDAQFSPHDPGLSIFCEKLLHDAMNQRWPVLILVTHWKRDLSAEFIEKNTTSFAGVYYHALNHDAAANGPAAGLPGGYLDSSNVTEIDLTPVPDLSNALKEALPGLTSEQSHALLDHAGGNPRHLEQIIAFLKENEDFFEDYDLKNALTEEGLQEALEETHDLFKVVMRRLRDAPPEVQEAICLASLQGVSFVSEIVNDLAKALLDSDREEALKRAVDPFSMVSRQQRAKTVAEFSERLFYLVAEKRRRSLKSLRDTDALTSVLKQVLRSHVANIDPDKPMDVDAALVTCELASQLFAESDPEVALNSLAIIVLLETKRFSYAAALKAADGYLKLFHSVDAEKLWERGLTFDGAGGVADLLLSEGRISDAQSVLTSLLQHSRALATRLQTAQSQRNLSVSLDWVGDAFHAGGDLTTATKLWKESLEIRRDLATHVQTPESQRNLTVSLLKVGEALHTGGDLTTATGLWQESLEIRRALATQLQTPLSQRDLSVSLDKVGDAFHAGGDLTTATGLWQESLEIRRALATQLQTPLSQRDLSVSLDKVGDAFHAGGNLTTATGLWQESLEISRGLAKRLQTPESQRDLSISLERVGDALHAGGDLTTATGLLQESLEISRALAKRLQTPESRRDLSISLERVGDALHAGGDLTTATGLLQESLEIRRALARWLQTPQSRRGLSVSLDKVGDALHAGGDLTTATGLWQESLEISRGLAKRLQTPESQRDLAVSLYKVGVALHAVGDLAAATGLWQESMEIHRALATRLQTPESRRVLSASLYFLASSLISGNKTELANTMIIEGTALIETLPKHMREDLAAAFADLRGEMESAQ
ncbi:hypothetical protein HJ526_12120 [Donghicola sp. C2-DW-16]|uniref:Orc1-like AAA ATPase domain-containing protein n=1 Tax=Donghicola mangrovi TaxID=2729614 RepID=A0ABX2PHB3_9RHOB|nr:ATP-binding protein [Donghicola mangrovi]NVO28172.1 hypothetical protein [Donghicola mangrovi]